jgi:hypothetical protein
MHYANKQLDMKNRVIKTTCGNRLVKVAEAQASCRPLIDHNTTNRLQLQNVIQCLICFSLAPLGLTTVCKTTN